MQALLLAALICDPANDKECRIEEEMMGFAPVVPSLDSQWNAVWKAAIVTKLDEKKHYPEAAVANRDMA